MCMCSVLLRIFYLFIFILSSRAYERYVGTQRLSAPMSVSGPQREYGNTSREGRPLHQSLEWTENGAMFGRHMYTVPSITLGMKWVKDPPPMRQPHYGSAPPGPSPGIHSVEECGEAGSNKTCDMRTPHRKGSPVSDLTGWFLNSMVICSIIYCSIIY